MRPRRRAVTWKTLWPIVPLVAVATVVAVVWFLIERSDDLAGEELRILIAGNTVTGVWGEANIPYKQYVDPSGTTLTSVEGGPAAAGTWRIDDDGRYCADLGGQSEACYPARRHQGGYLWVDQVQGLGYPFQVLHGKQVEGGGS